MKHSLVISIIIGSILGLLVAALSIGEWPLGLGLAVLVCLVAGLVTVLTIKSRPNVYALVASVSSYPFLALAYGGFEGTIYLAGVSFVYGIMAVQFFQAIGVAADNARFIYEWFRKRG
ncbi:hypothetical protein [Shewanella mangrovisoli]|uniref:Integral membrane protein n=1 Tax=Shewanella mangrovisoli TaxID=2864211 RepID=A0ABV4VLW0_9GAMM